MAAAPTIEHLRALADERRASGYACVARRLEDYARTVFAFPDDAPTHVDAARRALELVGVPLPRVVSAARLAARRELDENHGRAAYAASGIARAALANDRATLRQRIAALEVADRQRENAVLFETLARIARGAP